MNTCYLTAFSE